MTDTDLLIQNLRRENEALRAELEWKQKEIELARRHEMQWIPCDERLPEKWREGTFKEVDYLIYMPFRNEISVGVYDRENNCWFCRGMNVTVTYWSPLPRMVKPNRPECRVTLPCKVGDTVYEITSRNTINEYCIKAFRIELFSIFAEWEITKGIYEKSVYGTNIDEFGKTVFVTRGDAEKALEGVET